MSALELDLFVLFSKQTTLSTNTETGDVVYSKRQASQPMATEQKGTMLIKINRRSGSAIIFLKIQQTAYNVNTF